MRETIGVFRYEYLMQIRRWGLWVSCGLLTGFFCFFLISQPERVGQGLGTDTWTLGASLISLMNLLAPVAAAILIADRFPRDRQLHMSEVLETALPSSWSLVAGRLLGSLLAAMTPTLLILLAASTYLTLYLKTPATLLTLPVTFLALVLPTWLFFTAWSLIFPVVMPLRLYQVLFAGFWLWAIYINPKNLPTISNSILDPSGEYARYAFFIHDPATAASFSPADSVGWAIVNMLWMIGTAIIALALLPAVLRWREQQSGK
jgi:ABC-2 type transport system permease protein